MRLLLCLTMAIGATALGGCVVHDHNDRPEPIYWPTTVVRESTMAPADGRVQVHPAKDFFPPLNPDWSLREPETR